MASFTIPFCNWAFAVAPMFAETIMRYYNYQSVNAMFHQLPERVVSAGFGFTGLEL